MTKRHLIFLMVILLQLTTADASTWKIHNYFVTKKIQNVFDTGDKVYYLNSDRLFQFDKATLTTVALNRQNKLSDNQISQIYYDWQNKLLFVAYASSNIDVIDAAGNVTNINGIKDVLVPVHDYTLYTSGAHMNELESYVGKEIRDITFTDGKAYVAMGYGFAIIDESTMSIIRSVEVRNTVTINSVARIGDLLVILSDSYTYYGDPDDDDPINNYNKKSGHFENGKLYPIDDHSALLIGNSRLYYYDFSQATPALTSVISSGALPTCVQKTPTGYVVNFMGQSYYYTVDETGLVATKQGSAITFASSDPNGDGTVWLLDSHGLHISGSTAYYKINSLTTDQPYWLKYNAAMDLLFAGVAGPIAKINNNGTGTANVINTYDGTTWSNATAYTAAGAGYAFEFSPLMPTTYLRASWNKGMHKVKDNVLTTSYISNNAQIGTYKPTPAFDNYGNLWVVNSFGYASAPVAVLPADKFAKTQAYKSDWYVLSGMTDLNTGSTQRSRFIVARKNNIKIFIDGDFPDPKKPNQAKLFCWDNGEVDPTIDNYRMVKLDHFIDQNGRLVEWTYVNHLEQDNEGNVWMGHTSGIFMFDPDVVFDEQPRAVRPFVNRSTDKSKGNLCEGYGVFDIGVTRDNKKWLATDDGVYFVSPDGSEIYNHFTSENSDLPSNMVYSVECDTVHDRVYVYTDNGFAEYVPEGDAAALNFDGMYAFPDPVEPDFTGYVKIVGLMEDSYVTVTDHEGHVVVELGPVTGSALWDGSGDDGERVATGIYYIYAAQGVAPSTTGTPQATVKIIR